MSMPERFVYPTDDSVLLGTLSNSDRHLSSLNLSTKEELGSPPTDTDHGEVREDPYILSAGIEESSSSQPGPHDAVTGDDQEKHEGALTQAGDARAADQTHDIQVHDLNGHRTYIEAVELSETGDERKHVPISSQQRASPRSVRAPKTTTPPTTPPYPTPASGSPPNAFSLSNRASSAGDHEISLASSPRTSWELDADAKKPEVSNVASDEDSRSEIQTIMDQFDDRGYGSEDQDTTVSESALNTHLLTSPYQPPPRKSSLEHLRSTSPTSQSRISLSQLPPLNEKLAQQEKENGLVAPPLRNSSFSLQTHHDKTEGPTSPKSSLSLHKSLPPAPDPEPDLPFDFHRFLEQLRHRTADPVAKFLRSFLMEFGKKQWMVHEQIKIITDFLTFITTKMAQCDVWREVSDAEFDNAKEGMEKLVMNRLYSQTFSPAIPSPLPMPPTKGKRKPVEKSLGPGRRGQHQEDIERDDILAQKVRIYGWVQEEHLDIPPVGNSGKRFLSLAQQELLKIKSYRAPRDKVICVLNCCKVIFGLLRNAKSADTSADSFVPLLIYVVLQANPDHLVSNVQYIMRFRNQDKLGGEAGYYLSSLMGAIQFIENMDRTSLTVSNEDFEKNVEAAVSAIAERHEHEMPQSSNLLPLSEKSGPSRPEVTPRNSMDAERYLPRISADGTESKDATDENIAVAGLLRTIKRPLSSIGRMFSEELTSPQHPGHLKTQQVPTHPPETPRRLSPAVFQPPQANEERKPSNEEVQLSRSPRIRVEDAAARQASAETAEADRIQRAEHQNVVETLAGMFPDLDRDVIDDVVREKQGRVGLAVDACLAFNS